MVSEKKPFVTKVVDFKSNQDLQDNIDQMREEGYEPVTIMPVVSGSIGLGSGGTDTDQVVILYKRVL